MALKYQNHGHIHAVCCNLVLIMFGLILKLVVEISLYQKVFDVKNIYIQDKLLIQVGQKCSHARDPFTL